MKRIVLTGGGTGGHVTPNIALLPSLREHDFDIHYIGSFEGMEKELITEYGIPYYGISTGKFRRYFDMKNFTDPFRVMKGYLDARKILKKLQPDIIFSKGGFVSVPVVRAAHSLDIPCIIHESDMSPGLANKLCIPVADKICCNFPETLQQLPENKAILTGSPIREELFKGDKKIAMKLCGFNDEKPVIMVIGGSLGAAAVNKAIRDALPKLLADFQVLHICGKGKIDNLLLNVPGYKQFEFVRAALKDMFALADIVISRAGANAICEILALRKPNILIPLSGAGSRGEQSQNAQSFESQGFSMVINEDDLIDSVLMDKVHNLFFSRQFYIDNMDKSYQKNAIPTIISLIEKTMNK